MIGFFKGVFGLGEASADASAAERRTADLRDSIVDQLVTILWALLLIGQEWARRADAAAALPVAAMGLTAVGYGLWRLARLVGLWRGSL